MLVVDDIVDVAQVIASTLSVEGWDIEMVTSNFGQLFTPERWDDVDVAVVDYHLSGEMTGDMVLRYIANAAPHVRRVLASADLTVLPAQEAGADVVIGKPWTGDKLIEACRGR